MGAAEIWQTSGKFRLLCTYKGRMAAKVGGREPFLRCQPLTVGRPPAGWSGLHGGSERQRHPRRAGIWREAISPTKLTCDSSSRTRALGLKTASMSVCSCSRKRQFLSEDVRRGRTGGERWFSLHLQFPLLAELSKAKIIKNRWPIGFGTHLSTFGGRLPPPLAFPRVLSRAGKILLSGH